MTAERARHTSTARHAGALSAVRGDLEHDPRDPFRVSASDALDAMSVRWGSLYGFGYDGDEWQAWRLDGTGELLQGSTPDDLAAAILADLEWSTR